jgi:hypothetical protein
MICDLFLNEKLTISEIIGVFDEENYRSVVQALIKRGALLDRRQQQRLWSVDRRRLNGSSNF